MMNQELGQCQPNRELGPEVWFARRPSEGHDEQLFRSPVLPQIERGTPFDCEVGMHNCSR